MTNSRIAVLCLALYSVVSAVAQQPDTNALKRAEAQKQFQAELAKKFVECKVKAETGDPSSQFALALLYAYGTGVKEDRVEMMKWLRLAAVGNDGSAQAFLADCYDIPPGRFMKQDSVEAYAWRFIQRRGNEQVPLESTNLESRTQFVIHPAHGHEKARVEEVVETKPKFDSGIHPKDNRGSNSYTPQEVAAGKVRAKQLQVEIDARLAQMAAKKGAEDAARSAKRFQDNKPKAEAGNAEAQFNLALAYKRGEGVPKNEAEMMKWYRKSAEKGYARAQLELGNAYLAGTGGLKRDPVEAYAWLSLASELIPYACPATLTNGMSPEQLAAGKNRRMELAKQIQSQPGAINNRLPGMFPGPLK